MTRLALAVLVFAAASASAQTNPAPFDLSTGDYTFTAWPETAPAGTYPASMRLVRGGGQDPAVTAEPTADYTAAYNLTSGTRINGLGADGLAFANTGTNGDLGAAVLALNTTGLSNVRVSYTCGTVATGTRPYAIAPPVPGRHDRRVPGRPGGGRLRIQRDRGRPANAGRGSARSSRTGRPSCRSAGSTTPTAPGRAGARA